MNRYFLGIDCGGTNIRIGIVDQADQIFNEEKHATQSVGSNLATLIKSYLKKHEQNFNVEAIGIGFPGIVDLNTKHVLKVPNFKAFEGDYLVDLEKELGIPIVIGNDVNLLMLYDAKHFNIDKNRSVLGFYLGTGLGSAIRIHHMMYQGDFGAAGELGHVPIYKKGILKGERQVDLESEVSGFKLKEIHEKYFKDSPFDRILIDHFDSEVIQDFLHLLAIYIATTMTILDITTVILGGGVISSNQFPKSYLESLIKDNLFAEKTKEHFKVYYAQDDQNSGILGSVIFARTHLNI